MTDRIFLTWCTFKNTSRSCYFFCSILWQKVLRLYIKQKHHYIWLLKKKSWHDPPSKILFFPFFFYLSCSHFQGSFPRMNRRIRPCWLIWFDTDSKLWAFWLFEWDFPEIDNTDPVPCLRTIAYRVSERNARQGHVITFTLCFSLTLETIRKWWLYGSVSQGENVISLCDIVHYLPLNFYILLVLPLSVLPKIFQ